jgi:glutamate N-acetyltransferase/amino-acid N-acetyltransferase
MTTDTVPKEASVAAGPFAVGGAAKGVGMISPNLTTMLAFLTTDAPVPAAVLKLLADTEVKSRFNQLTVDGCTSTNDTVLLFASGAAGGDPVAPGTPEWQALRDGVVSVTESLVSQLIHDAEGVRHVLLVEIEGAGDDDQARTIARAVADSPLVKTAVFGEDPNPGRVLQAAGASGAPIDQGCLDVWIGDVRLVRDGVITPAYFTDATLHDVAKAAMAAPEITVRLRVGDGPGRSRVLGCDLTYDYVRINGEYTT